MTGWLEQKRQIDALNLFYSGIKGNKDERGLSSQGYKLVGPLLPIPDRRNDVDVRPDFTLYSGKSIIFVDVETSDEVSAEHRAKAQDYQDLNQEAVEEFIKKKGRADGMDLSVRDLKEFDYYLTFEEEVVESAKKGGPGAQVYEDMQDICAILSQSRAQTLSLHGGLTRDDDFRKLVSHGIDLPQTPSKEFMLTREPKSECLAVSLAQEILPNELSEKEEVQLTPNGVAKFYNRDLDLVTVRKSLEYLKYKDVCKEVGDFEYTVERSDSENLYEIEKDLRETTVDEYLRQHGGQQVALTNY